MEWRHSVYVGDVQACVLIKQYVNNAGIAQRRRIPQCGPSRGIGGIHVLKCGQRGDHIRVLAVARGKVQR